MYTFNTLGSCYCLLKQWSAYIINSSACIINVWGYTEIFPHFSPTTREKRDSPRSGYEVKLIINSIDNESSLEVPKVCTVERLNISELSIPRDRDDDK